MHAFRISIGIVGCYLLAYAAVLTVAARKGLPIADGYSLTVWLVSAAIIHLACVVLPLIFFAARKFRRTWLLQFFVFWSSLIVLFSLALILNAA